MTSKFYSDVIEEEIKTFKIEKKSLKSAVQSVSMYHSKRLIGKKRSVLDYHNPSNRCAYLYKYAPINTGLVTKYMRKMSKKKNVKSTLYSKKNIKLCCFGGGPGTDVLGVFRALAIYPGLHGKIIQVSILDTCDGWNNMLNNVMLGLLEGKVNDIPSTFIKQRNFEYKLTEIDLLNPLPEDVIDIISSADIICMTRFASDILGDSRSSPALKVLGSLIKVGALVLYIDIFNEIVFELSEDISIGNGLESVLGPLHEKFYRPAAAKKDLYGCVPQIAGKFSILGWCKIFTVSNTDESFDESCSTPNSDIETEYLDLESDYADSKSEGSDSKSQVLSKTIDMLDCDNWELLNEPDHLQCHKYTQTESNTFTHTAANEDLTALIQAVSNLLSVTERWKQTYA